MMWPGSFEPLFDQRVEGERVQFLWKQDGAQHTIQALWQFGPDPWDARSCETQNLRRHLAVEEAMQKIGEVILQTPETLT